MKCLQFTNEDKDHIPDLELDLVDDLSPDLDDLLVDESDDEDDEYYEPPHPAKAMDPDNYIQDLQALKSYIKDNLECQCCRA
jgi:hypothetical protein